MPGGRAVGPRAMGAIQQPVGSMVRVVRWLAVGPKARAVKR